MCVCVYVRVCVRVCINFILIFFWYIYIYIYIYIGLNLNASGHIYDTFNSPWDRSLQVYFSFKNIGTAQRGGAIGFCTEYLLFVFLQRKKEEYTLPQCYYTVFTFFFCTECLLFFYSAKRRSTRCRSATTFRLRRSRRQKSSKSQCLATLYLQRPLLMS